MVHPALGELRELAVLEPLELVALEELEAQEVLVGGDAGDADAGHEPRPCRPATAELGEVSC